MKWEMRGWDLKYYCGDGNKVLEVVRMVWRKVSRMKEGGLVFWGVYRRIWKEIVREVVRNLKGVVIEVRGSFRRGGGLFVFNIIGIG